MRHQHIEEDLEYAEPQGFWGRRTLLVEQFEGLGSQCLGNGQLGAQQPITICSHTLAIIQHSPRLTMAFSLIGSSVHTSDGIINSVRRPVNVEFSSNR